MDRGLAGMKFSGSRKIYGNQRMIAARNSSVRENPRMSLIV